ncbi:MAG: hypothetical protein EPN74_01635 [Rhodanobacter sp.]|nr:MAG: hypothetical protein EPN74_01635 [Rhodanobacter sp.]
MMWVPPATLRDILNDAVRYWESRRVAYNVALILVVAAWAAADWSGFLGTFGVTHLLQLLVLAVLANACYSAAYLVDIPIQHASFQALWRSSRWLLWLAGTLLAMGLAYFWIADEILASAPG